MDISFYCFLWRLISVRRVRASNGRQNRFLYRSHRNGQSRKNIVFMRLCGVSGIHFLRCGEQIILLFFISCIIESYIYSFLMNVTCDNIISAVTYHFAWNLLIHIAALNPVNNDRSIFPYLILVILETLALPVLRGSYRGGSLTKLMCIFPEKLKQPCQKILRRKD